MILVVLGTQDKPFTRLLEAIQNQCRQEEIRERIVVQAGHTFFLSDDMEIFDFLPEPEMERMICEADIIITHAGVGSVVSALKYGKKVIAAARLKKFGEHVNDHQTQLLDVLEKKGYILTLREFDKLDEVLRKAKDFKPKKLGAKQNKIVKLIEEFIMENC